MHEIHTVTFLCMCNVGPLPGMVAFHVFKCACNLNTVRACDIGTCWSEPGTNTILIVCAVIQLWICTGFAFDCSMRQPLYSQCTMIQRLRQNLQEAPKGLCRPSSGFERGYGGSVTRVAVWAMLLACTGFRQVAALDVSWTQYLEGAEMPMSATWRQKMRQKLQAIDAAELTPAIKMKRIQFLRMLEAEDNAPPPPPTGGNRSSKTLPFKFSFREVCIGLSCAAVVGLGLVILVPRLPGLVLGAASASVSGQGPSRGRPVRGRVPTRRAEEKTD